MRIEKNLRVSLSKTLIAHDSFRESAFCFFFLQGGRISFTGQVQNYQSAVQQLVNILGDEDSAANYLSKCIFSVGMGSNDYLNNYFMPNYYSTSGQYTPDQYADVLIQQYSQQIRVHLLLSLPF